MPFTVSSRASGVNAIATAARCAVRRLRNTDSANSQVEAVSSMCMPTPKATLAKSLIMTELGILIRY